MKNKKIIFFIVGIFLFGVSTVFAIYRFHSCNDEPLKKFSDGSIEKVINVPPGTGASIKLPENSKICSAKIKIDFSGKAEASTPYVWVPISGENKLVQIKVSDGTIIHTFQNGTDTCASNAFSNPSRITTIPGGDVWVANRDNGCVTRLGRKDGCSDDNCYECKGTYCNLLSGTRGVTYDANGNIWAGSHNSQRMCVYRSDGNLITCKDNSGCRTYGMIGDRKGNVWVSDRFNGKLCKCYLSNNQISCEIAASLTTEAYGIGIDNDDDIWVVKNAGTGEFCEYQQSTKNLNCYSTGAGGGWGKARGIAVDGDNNVWVAASSDNKVYKFDQSLKLLCNADLGGESRGCSNNVDVDGPIGIAIDGGNNAWVVYYDNPGKVFKIAPDCEKAKTIYNIGTCPYNYSDMTGFRTPSLGVKFGSGSAVYSFTPSTYPYVLCSENLPGCNEVDSNFKTELQNILKDCVGGSKSEEEIYCGNQMCIVPITLGATVGSGSFKLSDLEIKWEEPPSKLIGGLVPCGRKCDDPTTAIDETAPCTLCHLFVMGKRIIDFLTINVIFPLAILMFGIGGINMLIAGASGDSKKVEQARQTLTWTVIGVVVILGAWLIINTIIMLLTPAGSPFQKWNEINCSVPMRCGNKSCDPGETPENCPFDCPATSSSGRATSSSGGATSSSGGVSGTEVSRCSSSNYSACTNKNDCENAGGKWCPTCFSHYTNSWRVDKCVDPTISCGWHCVKGVCGAECATNKDCTFGRGCISCKCGEGPGPCLAEGSLILTPNGFKKIEDLKKGDFVIGYKDGKKAESKILEKSIHEGEFKLYYYKGYWFTENHLVYSDDYKEFKPVSEFSNITRDYKGKVYNIQTETQNYFGENGILIHNK